MDISILRRDEITGLLHPEDFGTLLGYELDRARRTRGDLALALLDLDEAARLERTGAGISRLLRELVPLVRGRFSRGAALGARPGHGIWILLSGWSREDALIALEDLRRLVASSTFKVPDPAGEGGRSMGITFSGGLSGFPRDGEGPAALVRQARLAMIAAKQAGGNRILTASAEKMVLKSSYYPRSQLEGLARLASALGSKESELLREALDLLFDRHEVTLKATVGERG